MPKQPEKQSTDQQTIELIERFLHHLWQFRLAHEDICEFKKGLMEKLPEPLVPALYRWRFDSWNVMEEIKNPLLVALRQRNYNEAVRDVIRVFVVIEDIKRRNKEFELWDELVREGLWPEVKINLQIIATELRAGSLQAVGKQDRAPRTPDGGYVKEPADLNAYAPFTVVYNDLVPAGVSKKKFRALIEDADNKIRFTRPLTKKGVPNPKSIWINYGDARTYFAKWHGPIDADPTPEQIKERAAKVRAQKAPKD